MMVGCTDDGGVAGGDGVEDGAGGGAGDKKTVERDGNQLAEYTRARSLRVMEAATPKPAIKVVETLP